MVAPGAIIGMRMKKNLLILPLVALAGLLLGGCDDEPYGYHDDRPSYRSGRTVDFYYTSGRPYSRSYGPLYHRDGRYYYSRGGSYVVYDRPVSVYRENTHVIRRDVNVGDRYDRYDRRDRDRDVIRRTSTYQDGGRRYDSSNRRTEVYRVDDRRSSYYGGSGSGARVINRSSRDRDRDRDDRNDRD